jgi:hypothetical protein
MSNRLPIVCTRQIDRINFGDSYEDFWICSFYLYTNPTYIN